MQNKIKNYSVQNGIFFSKKQQQSLPYKNQSELALYLLNEFARTVAGYWHIRKLLPLASANDPMVNASIFIVVDIFQNKEIVWLQKASTDSSRKETYIKNKTKEFCEIKNIKFTVFDEVTIQHGFTVLNLKNLYWDSGLEIPAKDVFAIEHLLKFRNSISIGEIKQHVSREQSINSLLFHQILITDLEKEIINDATIVERSSGFGDFIKEVKGSIRADQIKNN